MQPVTAESSPRSFSSAQGAVAAMVARLNPVGHERIALADAAGRVTAERIVADRDSPPSDVSAMDGYAVRLADLSRVELAVAATVLPGCPAPPMPAGAAVRIMTGAVVPQGAEAVIRREDVREMGDRVAINQGVTVSGGQNIRRRGDNLATGVTVVEAGVMIGPAVATALASFGVAQVAVHRRVRIGVVVTGDELRPAGAEAEPWQIRDSNGPALQTLLASAAWTDTVGTQRVRDEYSALLSAVRQCLGDCDALLLTGGVSAGTHDFVPAVLREAGCETVFHRLPQRPGQPVLGAVGPQGQAVLGLPGNPQSVMTTARRIAVPALWRLAGLGEACESRPVVALRNHDGRSLHLWWYRPVRLVTHGEAELVESRGSGDVVSAARCEGFVEIPPHESGAGPWPFFGWGMGR